MHGQVEQHFSGMGFKRLSAVECISAGVSNQHEFGSSQGMRDFLGTERKTFGASFFYLTDSFSDSGDYIEDNSWVTYYDSRENQAHRSAEYRIFYPTNTVMAEAQPDDYFWLGRLANDPEHLLIIIAKNGDAISRQLDRLFGTGMRHDLSLASGRSLRPGDLGNTGDDDLGPDDITLLELLNIPVEVEFGNELQRVIDQFGALQMMPPTKMFCEFVRSICPGTDEHTDIDTLLHRWFVFTTEMFLGLQQYIVGPQLDSLFANKPTIDVEVFFATAMRLQQSRYSRAGASWESHLEAAFRRENVRFVHNTKKLSDGTKPDFLFPSLEKYVDERTPNHLLTFVGAKTTAKERWMQLVAEGHRTGRSYLATMDRDLNEEVLTTMANKNVIPVIPSTWVAEHYETELPGVISFTELIAKVRNRETQLYPHDLTV